MLMKCLKCDSETYETVITDIFDLEPGILVVENVPCHKCKSCGNEFYIADVAVNINRFKENVKSIYQDLTIIDYSKAAGNYQWTYII